MEPPPGSGESSPDQSSCSSDPGDVLVRSTRALLSDRRHEAGPGPGSVQITVQRLRDPPAQHQRSGTERRPEHRPRPRRAAPLRAAERAQPGESSGRCPQSTGDLDPVVTQRGHRDPDRRALKKPGPGPGPGPGLTKENRKPPAAESPDRKLDDQTQSDRQPGQELLTSCFAAGGRGVVLAALKQRSHSAPHRREVKVQLLDSGPLPTSSQDALGEAGVQMVADLSSGRPGDASNAASACCVETRSDLEVQVSQLANEVQRLLQADREGGDRRRSLSQQTLHHLEMLQSHQLQLQSQLLESALRIVTGHTHVTSTISDITAPGQPPHLQVTHLDTAENVLSNQQRNSSATRAAAATVEMGPVAMATPRCDRWPDQTRADQYLQGAPSVSTATQTAAGSHLQSSANHSQTVAKTANEMLREMGCLKSEMKILLTQPEDSLKTTRPGPEHSHSQQNHFQSLQSKSQQSKSQQTETRQVQSQPNQPQSQPNQSQSQPNQSQSQPNQSHQTKPQLSQQSPSVLVQRRPLVPSMLEEAGQVLRQVRRQKKVLEENLESLLRAKTGEVLHCQLEALSADRDWTQEVRIKKTVDAWISSLTEDIQAEMSSEDTVRRPADAVIKPSASRDAAVTSQRSAGSSAHTGRGGPVSALRGTGSKTAAGSGGRTAGRRPGAEPDRPTGGLSDGEQVEGGAESYLTRLYGRAPYEGLRRTLKKSPYLRLSSPASPLGRKPRPRLVESVRGVKVKSCKTQTCLAPPLGPSPGPPPHHYIISSSHLTSGDPADLTVTPTCAVPMAIPLGRPRMDSSRCLAEHQQEVTSPPTAPPTSGVVGVDSGASEPQSQEAEPLEAGEAPPPPADITERKNEEDEEEENVFPGTDFLSVADFVQEEEEEEEEGEGVSVVGEEAVELDGGPSPPPVLYQGPAFPPRALSSLPAQDQASVPGLGLQRDVLENRLVEWVEQQLMSRMISEMYRPPPSDPAQNNSADQSEREAQSVTSDIEAAGGLQLFVDSNVSVDSALIRQLVHEVLTEHVALMLGHRDKLEAGPRLEPPKLGPGAHQKDNLVPLVLTPVPTPPPSPTLSSREAPPLTTPPPSEPTSLLNEESPQPITAAKPVATPTSSPEPAHSAGSPPDVHQAPPPLTWGDAELPLDEERPEEHLDTHPLPLVMSVAEEEPPLSSPRPPPPFIPPPPSPCLPPPSPDPRPASPSSSSESTTSSTSSTSSSSSSAVTAGTEAALRHISEGELLISVNQLAAMTEDEPVCSFSSSLQELQEMDFDPPSEGQVRGHDLLLTLLTKMEQGVTQRGERPQPEGSWGGSQEEEVSVGEVRDDRTTNPKSLSRSAAAQQGRSSSPGQISQCADVPEVHFEATNQGSALVGDLMVEPMGTLTSDLQTDLSLSPPPHLENTGQGVPVLVRQSHRRTVEQQQGGTWKMAVHLPSIRPEEEDEEEEEEEEEEEIERSPCAAADTDSSTNDVF